MSFKIEKTKLSSFLFFSTIEKTKVMPVPEWAIWSPNFSQLPFQSTTAYNEEAVMYGVVYQKVRRKTMVTKERNTQESGCGSFYKRELVREAHWVITVYEFPMSRVKHLRQHKNHFDVVLY